MCAAAAAASTAIRAIGSGSTIRTGTTPAGTTWCGGRRVGTACSSNPADGPCTAAAGTAAAEAVAALAPGPVRLSMPPGPATSLGPPGPPSARAGGAVAIRTKASPPETVAAARPSLTSAEDASSAARQCENADCAGRRSMPIPMPLSSLANLMLRSCLLDGLLNR